MLYYISFHEAETQKRGMIVAIFHIKEFKMSAMNPADILMCSLVFADSPLRIAAVHHLFSPESIGFANLMNFFMTLADKKT